MLFRTNRRWLQLVFFFSLILISVSPSVFASVTKTEFIGEQIPKRISYGARPIFGFSDSLFINGRLLERGKEYLVDDANRQFVLQITPNQNDTFSVRYTPFPAWVVASYNSVIPSVEPRYDVAVQPAASFSRVAVPSPSAHSQLNISGSKSFRVASRTEGNRQFGQSIDLQVNGFLTPSIRLDGAISDRGYDPAYGTSTSRLRELENVRLKLTAPVLTAQVGDIDFLSGFDSGKRQESRLYGFSATAGQANWNVTGTAARARGRFTSKSLLGIDNVQGPYQITESNAIAIVPGSETVWLNGAKLERSADQGYTIEYPTGRITFSSRYPIDRRSRIEVDYEIAETAYRPSLFSGGAKVAGNDSIVFAQVEWLQEKDGETSLSGELSQSDKQILSDAGDNTVLAVRSGVRADSLGAYVLDSTALPDSIFTYVGKGNGDYSLTFRYAGSQNGSYRFEGGDRYRYVGVGRGEYLPQIQLSAPEQQSYYRAKVGTQYPGVGKFSAEVRQSVYDQNLFSSHDDADNSGLLYQFGFDGKWGKESKQNRIHLLARTKESEFVERSRVDAADFHRQFLLPLSFMSLADERYYSATGAFHAANFLQVSPEFAYLTYSQQTKATRTGGTLLVTPHTKLDVQGGLVAMELTTDNPVHPHGSGKTAQAAIRYRMTDNISVTPSWNYDDRRIRYNDTTDALTSSQLAFEIQGKHETLRLEQLREDTLETAALPTRIRNRLMLTSRRRIGNLTYTSTITGQMRTENDVTERNLLSDLDMSYASAAHRLSVTTAYSLSHETRNARGITYLEVPTGQGTHRLENGQYIPDPDGNYIQVEEILSDHSAVSRGRKSFQLQKAWSMVNIRFVSHIEEELLSKGERTALWAVPFLSDENEPYLFYDRRYEARTGFIPLSGVDAILLQYADSRQSRLLGNEQKLRTDRTARVTLTQPVKAFFCEEQFEWFAIDRDAYYSGGGSFDGFMVSTRLRGMIDRNEYTSGVRVRSARTTDDIKAVTFASESTVRVRLFDQCEWSNSLEVYLNKYSTDIVTVSYLLTDDRPGKRGSIWSSGFKYRVRNEVRIDAGISGRHADDRSARLLFKGEVLVTF